MIKRKEEQKLKVGAPPGSLEKIDWTQNEVVRRAMFDLRQRAKQFRQVNSDLMMTTQKVPIDILLQ